MDKGVTPAAPHPHPPLTPRQPRTHEAPHICRVMEGHPAVLGGGLCGVAQTAPSTVLGGGRRPQGTAGARLPFRR